MNEELMKEMLSKKNWAVVGVTPRKEKVAYKIFQRLIEHGYNVYPVNPKYEKIDDRQCYKSIEDLPMVPDCVDFVVPPTLTKAAIEEISPDKIENLWFQPGSYDDEAVKMAEEKGFKVVHEGACVMMAVETING